MMRCREAEAPDARDVSVRERTRAVAAAPPAWGGAYSQSERRLVSGWFSSLSTASVAVLLAHALLFAPPVTAAEDATIWAGSWEMAADAASGWATGASWELAAGQNCVARGPVGKLCPNHKLIGGSLWPSALVGLAAASLAPNDAPPLSLSQHGAVMKRRSTAEIKSAGRPYVDLPEQET